MSKKYRTISKKIIIYAILILGVTLVVISSINSSSFLAILGVTIDFWGVLLLLITPSKQVPLALLNASADANASNIERLLSESNLTEKCIYLPPKNLNSVESSVIFIPKSSQTVSTIENASEDKLWNTKKTGIFLTPLGLSLAHLFEEKLGTSFASIDFGQFLNVLPHILVEDLEIAEAVELNIKNKVVTVEITGSLFEQNCRQTDNQPKTHEQVGCVLSSSIACALAKVLNKPIIIQRETTSTETKTILIEYLIKEE